MELYIQKQKIFDGGINDIAATGLDFKIIDFTKSWIEIKKSYLIF